VRPSITLAFLIGSNLALQIFDGVATYIGWSRFGEANPLLHSAFTHFGAGPSLVAAKLMAAALILMLVGAGLSFTMAAYVSLSLIPWSLRLWL
jgi:hypothetical protein